VSESVDEEVEAIKTVLGALTPLTPDARGNVLEYVLKRFGFSYPSAAVGSTTLLAGSGPSQILVPQSSAGLLTHIKDLKTEKKPRSANEMAALVAYFLANVAPQEQRKPNVNTKDIETYFKIAEFPLPEQIKMTLPNAKNAGYFDAVGDGEYRLNAVGHNLVVHSMPRGAGSSEPSKRSRKKVVRKPKTRAKKSR
jgi:hypothetical protein